MSVQHKIAAASLVLLSFFAANMSQAAEQASEQDKAAVVSVMQIIATKWNEEQKFAKDSFESSVTIIDNTAPYLFQGPGAGDDWIAAYRSEQPKGSEDAKTALHFLEPQSVKIKGSHAYIAVPADWSVELKGKNEVAHGIVTAALNQAEGHWRVSAWTWTPR
jgi:hypothetical protein